MFRLLNYFRKEVKTAQSDKLDNSALVKYIYKKSSPRTALAMGKYQLALYVKAHLDEVFQATDIDYQKLKNFIYIAYIVNQFLEQPKDYASILELPVIFSDRSGLTLLKKESAGTTILKYSENELKKIFDHFAIMHNKENVTFPDALPAFVRTGSGVIGRYSNLHSIIHSLYEQCELKKQMSAVEFAMMANPTH